jgi:pyrroline-5-carboxylate reductase
MAAGVKLEKIEAVINCPTIRIMPNTPVSVGMGMISFCKNEKVDGKAALGFEEIMSKAGRLIELDEKLIDAATAVAGCGPAFVYMFAEALADGGVQCGLSRDASLTLAAETIKGAAEMILKTGKHPEQLKDEVCSPAGTTIVGVKTLEDKGLRSAIIAAVDNTVAKSREMSRH